MFALQSYALLLHLYRFTPQSLVAHRLNNAPKVTKEWRVQIRRLSIGA
jgi:hypothetical protein